MIFTVFSWAPHEIDAEIKISGHLDYLGRERNTSRGMDECDKENASSSQLPLWVTGAQTHYDNSLRPIRAPTSELSHPKGEGLGWVFMHQSLTVTTEGSPLVIH